MAAEPVGLDRCKNHRHAKNLRRLRQHQHIVEQGLTVNVRHAEEHLRLVIDEHHCAIARGQQALSVELRLINFFLRFRLTGRKSHRAWPIAIDQRSDFHRAEGLV